MQLSDFEFKEIPINDPLIRICADIVQKYSWGENYPVNAYNELRQNEYTLGALYRDKLVGLVCLNRVASPDNIDNGKLWLADAVVLPEFREQKLFTFLYSKVSDYLTTKNEQVFACTDNPIIEKFLSDRGWSFYRNTKDEDGGDCKVFTLEASN